jgi:hypothetical protein
MAAVGSKTTPATGSGSTGPVISAVAVPAHSGSNVVDPTGILAGASVAQAGAAPAVWLDNAYAELTSGATGQLSTTAPNENTLTCSTANFVTAGVLPGDRVVVSQIVTGQLTWTFAKTVQSVVSATQLAFTSNFISGGNMADVTGVSRAMGTLITTATAYFRVERAVAGVQADQTVTIGGTATSPTATTAALTVKVSVAGVPTSKPVTYAEPYLAYRELRTDLAMSPVTCSSVADIKMYIGEIDERNPGAVAAYVALVNSDAQVMFAGVPSDDTVGHSTVQANVRGSRSIYAIVPVTQNSQIITNWKADCVALADPSIAKFRVVLGNVALSTLKTIVASVSSGTVEANDGTHRNLLDNTQTFVTSGVQVNDIVTILATPYTVSAILSENRITVNGQPATGPATYTITRALTKDQQVADLVATANGLNSPRAVLVWPDTVSVSGVTNAYTGIASKQPGYYAAAAIGGMVAGLPPHQGFTYIGLAGVSQIYNSNTYFTDAQLDTLSSNGLFLLVQDAPTAAPYSYHEVTTNVQTLESSELMVVKNFDYVSLTIRNALTGFLGVYNVTTQTLDFLRAAVLAAASQLKANTYPKIGAPLIDLTITSLAVLPGSKDRVDLSCSVQIPRPLNRIGLHLLA